MLLAVAGLVSRVAGTSPARRVCGEVCGGRCPREHCVVRIAETAEQQCERFTTATYSYNLFSKLFQMFRSSLSILARVRGLQSVLPSPRTLSPIFSSSIATSSSLEKDLRIAIIGQSVFGQEVYKLLRRQGRNVVGVFTIPDDKNNGRPDPLAVQAEQDGVPVFKFPRWRLKGESGLLSYAASTSVWLSLLQQVR